MAPAGINPHLAEFVIYVSPVMEMGATRTGAVKPTVGYISWSPFIEKPLFAACAVAEKEKGVRPKSSSRQQDLYPRKPTQIKTPTVPLYEPNFEKFEKLEKLKDKRKNKQTLPTRTGGPSFSAPSSPSVKKIPWLLLQ